MTSARAVGERGEQIAADFLENQGYRILERNYRFERAEVDLVCFQPHDDYSSGGQIVFVEVKSRSGKNFGAPEDAVDAAKKQQIVKASRAYLYEYKMEGSSCRFDVVTVLFARGEGPEISHFKDAFWAP